MVRTIGLLMCVGTIMMLRQSERESERDREREGKKGGERGGRLANEINVSSTVAHSFKQKLLTSAKPATDRPTCKMASCIAYT
jgi:hypothetical protein